MAQGTIRPPSLGASRTLIDAMRGRVTGKVCSMVCGYDKVKVPLDREARRLEHVCFEREAAMLNLTPIEPAAHYERPAVECFARCLPPGVYLSDARSRGG